MHSLALLDRALTHSSYVDRVNGQSDTYERLEFLGDSVLNASISYLLFNDHPRFMEGKLSAFRSSLVDETTLAEIGIDLGIPEFINLGRGERLTDIRAKNKVTADIVESIIAVLFIEKGFDYTYRFVDRIMREHIERRLTDGVRDFKTSLQKISMETFKKYPVYRIVGEIGPDHNKTFKVEVEVNGNIKAVGVGRSKKAAEQDAAEKVLDILEKTKHKADGR
ncbi:MAG: ribonuclease III [Spirochaetes bacterium GWF1_51_8]|nr:MAG: ribonuclease III [Spirochaetes bacterium GWF1_51_8]